MKKPLINKKYTLQKFGGKGGWTYALIPEIPQNKKNPFGWLTVSGFIDNFELKHYKLMPFSASVANKTTMAKAAGNGKLFMPVKATTRKAIGKQAGDTVHIKISIDTSPIEIPAEIIECFRNESPTIYSKFWNLLKASKKHTSIGFTKAKKKKPKLNES